MVNNQLALFQEMIADFHRLLQEAAGVATEVKNQSLQVLLIQLAQRLAEFIVGVLVEFVDMDVGDARANSKRVIHAVLGNLITGDFEFEWLVIAFAKDCNLNLRALGTLENFGYLGGVESVRR